MDKPVLLEVKDLKTYFYSGKHALKAVDSVSFSIREGEVFGLVGESGSGKSITCKSLIGLIHRPGRIAGGSIRYRGQELAGLSEKALTAVRGKEIGMIFQEPMVALNPVLRIGQQITESFKEPGLSGEEKHARAVELLRRVGIPNPEQRMREYPHQFSGGMRQRVVIAIALASNPKLLLADRGCPFFKRRSFFTPYADELRRTDGRAAAELYDYLKSETDYPVDDLLRALLPVQPLAAMAQNLHWHYILPQTAGECAPILLDANTLAKGCALQPDAVYCLPLPRAAGVEGYYYAWSMPTSLQLAQAAELFDAHPLVGVLGPALPLYAGCAAEKARRWQQQKPAVQAKLSALDCPLPLDETPPPLPNGGCLLVRGAAFPQGLPPLQTESDFWLVPLLAQYNGYASATFETAAQCAARADVLDAALAAQRGVGPVFRLMGRTVKNALRKRKESAR